MNVCLLTQYRVDGHCKEVGRNHYKSVNFELRDREPYGDNICRTAQMHDKDFRSGNDP